MIKSAWVAVVPVLLLLVSAGSGAGAAPPTEITAAPPDPQDERIDEYGISVPVSAHHPGRRFPAEEGYPTGPEVGTRLPDFRLRNQHGEWVDFQESSRGRRTAVVFYRSAVW